MNMQWRQYGLGAIESPPDPHDFDIEQAYLAAAIEPVAVPPSSFTVAKLPPVDSFNQHDSPMCVAYSNSLEQASFDLVDLGHNYKWDRGLFFRRIGGTIYGAVPRNALAERLHRGYPLLPVNSGNSTASHRISAYYLVPNTKLAVQQALISFGVLLFSGPWFDSWFDPAPDGTLPPPNYQAGRHEWSVVGYRPAGVWCQQTWGSAWGHNGFFLMPWNYVLHSVSEIWKARDQKTGD